MNAVRILRVAAGGDGVGRLEDGRAVFVPRSAPGDLVELTGLRCPAPLRPRAGGAGARAGPRPDRAAVSPLRGRRVRRLPAAAPGGRRAAGGTADASSAMRSGGSPVWTLSDPEIEPAEQELEYRTKITLHVDARAGTIGLHPVWSRRAGLRSAALPHHRGRAQPPLGRAPAAAPSLPAAPADADAAARPAGGCHAVFQSARGTRWSRRRRTPRCPRGRRRARRRSGGGRRVARRGASRGGRAVSGHGVRAGASRDGRPGPGLRRRGAGSSGRPAGVGSLRRHRRDHGRAGAGRRHGRERRVGRPAVAEAEARGPVGAAAHRPGRGRARPSRVAGPRRHQSSPRRHGPRRCRPSWSGGGRSGSSTSPAIPRPWPGTSRG